MTAQSSRGMARGCYSDRKAGDSSLKSSDRFSSVSYVALRLPVRGVEAGAALQSNPEDHFPWSLEVPLPTNTFSHISELKPRKHCMVSPRRLQDILQMPAADKGRLRVTKWIGTVPAVAV